VKIFQHFSFVCCSLRRKPLKGKLLSRQHYNTKINLTRQRIIARVIFHPNNYENKMAVFSDFIKGTWLVFVGALMPGQVDMTSSSIDLNYSAKKFPQTRTELFSLSSRTEAEKRFIWS